MAHPVARVEHGERPADHDRRVRLGGHEDMGGHRGGGGFSVGAGDTQSVLIPLHDGAPGLGPLIDRDAPGYSAGDLGVIIVDGGGANDQLGVLQIVC